MGKLEYLLANHRGTVVYGPCIQERNKTVAKQPIADIGVRGYRK